MKNIIRLYLVLLLTISILASIGLAWQDNSFCTANSNCLIKIFVVNNTDVTQELGNQICNITILNSSNAIVINNQPMQNSSTGWHNYSYNTASVDDYVYSIVCIEGSEKGIVSGEMYIRDSLTTQITHISTQIEDNTSDIITHGDSEWITVNISNLPTKDELQTNTTEIIDKMFNGTLGGAGINPDDLINLSTQVNITSILTNLAIAQVDLDNPNQYKADVSDLVEKSELQSNVSYIITHGDTTWTGSTAITDADKKDIARYAWSDSVVASRIITGGTLNTWYTTILQEINQTTHYIEDYSY